jgi:hypothetical protein
MSTYRENYSLKDDFIVWKNCVISKSWQMCELIILNGGGGKKLDGTLAIRYGSIADISGEKREE